MKKIQITVQAILIRNDQVLLMKRKNTGFKDGFYGLPGGKLQGGESPTEAILRELKEELGCSIEKELVSFNSLMEFDYLKSVGKVIYFNFLLYLKNHKIVNNELNKCDEIVFFPKNSLPANTIEATSKSIQNYIHNINYFECVDTIT